MASGCVYAGVPSFFCFGIRGWSYSNVLASTVMGTPIASNRNRIVIGDFLRIQES